MSAADPLFPLFVRPGGRVRRLRTEPTRTTTLTPQQARALRHIVATQKRRGYPPSVRELMADLGLRSPASVSSLLNALEVKGRIRRDPGLPRALEVLAS